MEDASLGGFHKSAGLNQTSVDYIRVTKDQETSDSGNLVFGESLCHLNVNQCLTLVLQCPCLFFSTFIHPLVPNRFIKNSLPLFPFIIQTVKPATEKRGSETWPHSVSVWTHPASAEALQLKHPGPLSVCDSNTGVKRSHVPQIYVWDCWWPGGKNLFSAQDQTKQQRDGDTS